MNEPATTSPLKRLPAAIILLGVVSLLMDVASEMLYPVAPVYLTTIIGASVLWVGIIEGLAEAVSGISKWYFGFLSDRKGVRRPFVTGGYGLSALSKPLPALFATVGGFVFSRVVDRIGKGIRTAPRDALIAAYSDPSNRGAAFGLHRAMDTLGAALGPVLALLYLSYHPGGYKTLFLLAFIPSALAALATLLVKEVPIKNSSARPGLGQTIEFWRKAPSEYRRLVLWFGLFALANSSDVFLILRAREVGFSDTAAIGGYICYNIVYALASFPGGKLSDKVGRKVVVCVGLVVYAGVYVGFALAHNVEVIWLLFMLYGVYAACTEGISKAWISDLVPDERRGAAIGFQTALVSLCALAASSWTGGLWAATGATAPLLITAAAGIITAIALTMMPARREPTPA